MASLSVLRDGALATLMTLVDGAMAVTPRRRPSAEALQRCRIISHRGEHNKTIAENTLAAFRTASDAGVWGIECDIRFTKDLVPVICHDPTAERVFGHALEVAHTPFVELRAALPDIPTLAEVVATFGGRTHLMLELKHEHWPDEQQQQDALRDILAPLTPVQDYHLLSLHPAMFDRVPFAPNKSYLPVAETNVNALSQFALDNGCAGLGGHYLLLGENLKHRHAAVGQRLGTGFPTSDKALRRELNRGIEWVFSNHAVKLEKLRRRYLSELGMPTPSN